jgi:hypothetical protein
MDVSIGLGIIVGCSMVCITAIYLFTRNIWNWRKIFIHTCALIILCLLIFTSIYLIESNRTKKINEISRIERDKGFVKNYWGLSFTNTFADVIYYKGDPISIYSNESGGIILDYSVKSENIERWVRFGGRSNNKDANSTNQIESIHSNVNYDLNFADFGNIKIQDSFSDVQKEFKTQLIEKKLDDLNSRVYKIGNISFLFKNNRLDGVYVFNTNKDLSGFGTNWVKIK